MTYRHGGDWTGYTEEYGRDALDFSANVSPLGLPEGVACAVRDSLRYADRYPDPYCRRLRQALGEVYSLAPEQIVCGNGASDLIWRIVMAVRPREAVVPAPVFSEYEHALNFAACRVTRWNLSEESDGCTPDFSITSKKADRLTELIKPGTDILFLCEPNNPTGITTDHDILLKILDHCRQTGTLLVADECFMDFLERPKEHTLAGELDGSVNLIILRAFTKAYAMAGLRLGYALCGSRELARMTENAGPSWQVSSAAQAAGIAALRETEYLGRVRDLINHERPRMKDGLEGLGCRVCPGEANYLLFACERTDLDEQLRKKGILIRTCRDFAGLGPGWYRTAVRTVSENDILLEAVREVLSS